MYTNHFRSPHTALAKTTLTMTSKVSTQSSPSVYMEREMDWQLRLLDETRNKVCTTSMQIMLIYWITDVRIICIASCATFVSGFIKIDEVVNPFPSPLSMCISFCDITLRGQMYVLRGQMYVLRTYFLVIEWSIVIKVLPVFAQPHWLLRGHTGDSPHLQTMQKSSKK